MNDILSFLNGPVPTNAPPNIYVQPRSQSVSYGAEASFSVFADGTPPFDYQWQFKGTNIPGATGNYLTIDYATTNDSGAYSVIVTNAFDSATSQVATLTVAAPIAPPTRNIDWVTPEGGGGPNYVGGM